MFLKLKYLEPTILQRFLVAVQPTDLQETKWKHSKENLQMLPSKNNTYYSLSIFLVKVKQKTLLYLLNRAGRTRTDTVRILSPFSLPIGIQPLILIRSKMLGL